MASQAGISSAEGSPLEKLAHTVQMAWLQVLVLVNRDTHSSTAGVVVSEVISLLQLLAVPIAVVLELERRGSGVSVSTGMRETLFALSLVNPDSVKQAFGETVFQVLFAIALLSVMSFVVMALIVGITVASRSAKHNPVLLRSLRATARLSATTLFLPWTSLLLQSLGCDGGIWWGGGGIECYGVLHSTIAVVVLLLLPFFIVASLSVASVYIDRKPTSDQLDARTHGRADVLLLIVKVCLTALLTYGTASAPEWLLVGLLFASGGLWLYLFLHMVPFASLTMNAAHVGMASCFLWATLCAAVSWAAEGKADVGLLVLLGTPLAGVLGYTAARARFIKLVTPSDPYSIQDLWPLVLWTRERMRAAEAMKKREVLSAYAATAPVDAPALSQQDTNSRQADDASETASFSVPAHVSAAATRWGITPEPGKPLSAQVQEAAITGIEAVEDLFSSLGIAHSVASSFWQATDQKSTYKERQALTRARALSRAFDINFNFFQQMQQQTGSQSESRRTGGRRGRAMSVVDRLLFDQHKRTALEAEAECYAVHVLLMKHVASRSMDIGFLHAELGARLDEAMRTATQAFDAMLRINSESPDALNAAAEFHLKLSGDVARGRALLKEASRIDDNNRRAKERMVTHVAFGSKADDDLSPADEQNASFTISADRARLGEIVAINAAAIRMFGSNSLLGSNIDCILPSGPLREVHDSFLAKFVQTGTSNFLDSTRLLLAQHSAGHLFPVRFRLFETPPSVEDMRPKLTGLLAPVTSNEGFVVVGDESYGFSITSVCLRTAALLQRPADLMGDLLVPAALIFPQLFGDDSHGDMVNDDVARPGMRRVGSSASNFRPPSARSHAASVALGKQPVAPPATTRRGSAVPEWMQRFPKAMHDSLSRHVPVNLFVPAMIIDDELDEGADAESLDELGDADSLGSAGKGSAGSTGGLQRVQEVEDEHEDADSSDGNSSLDAADSLTEASDEGAHPGRDSDAGMFEDEIDPAHKRVEPSVVPVMVRCYRLPKRTPTAPSGVVVSWSRVAGTASKSPAGQRTGPASRSATGQAQRKPARHVMLVSPSEEAKAVRGSAGSLDSGESGLASSSAGQPTTPDATEFRHTETDSGRSSSPHHPGFKQGAIAVTSIQSKQARAAPYSQTAAGSSSLGNASVTSNPSLMASGSLAVDDDAKAVDQDVQAASVKAAQVSIRRSLKRALDLMAQRPSTGVRLMRRSLLLSAAVFAVIAIMTMVALGPWAERITLHTVGIRTAGHIIEDLHQAHLVVEVLSTEDELRSQTGHGWPVTSYDAVVACLHKLPSVMFSKIQDFYTNIQTLGGSVVQQATTSDAVQVVAESAGAATPDVGLDGNLIKGRLLQQSTRSLAETSSSSSSALVNMSLFDAAQAVQQAVESLSKLNTTALDPSDPNVLFVLQNAKKRIGGIMNETLVSKVLALEEEMQSIEMIEVFVFVVVLSLTVVGQMILSCVATWQLWKEQIALLSIFYEIPSRLARVMASRSEMLLRKHRRHTASITGLDDGMGEDSDDSEERQRQEGEDIRWQLLVERLSRVAQMDWASEQAQALGIPVNVFLKTRKERRGSICLDAIIKQPSSDTRSRRHSAATRPAPPGVNPIHGPTPTASSPSFVLPTLKPSRTSGGSYADDGGVVTASSSTSKKRRQPGHGRRMRSSTTRKRKGDKKIHVELLRERRLGVRIHGSSGARVLLLLLSLAPSLIIAVWFATVYKLDIDMHQRVLRETERLMHLQQLSLWAGELAEESTKTAVLPSVANNQSLQVSGIAAISKARESFVVRRQLVLHGGVSAMAEVIEALTGQAPLSLTPVTEESTIFSFLQEDGCPAVLIASAGSFEAEAGIVSNASCYTVHDGVFGKGMAIATSHLLAHARAMDDSLQQLWSTQDELATLRANSSSSPAAIASAQGKLNDLQSNSLLIAGTVVQSFDPWLKNAFLKLEHGLKEEVAKDVARTWELQRSMTFVFLALFAVATVFGFSPRLTWVERIVAATRKMLLVVPDEVLIGFPRLSESVKELEGALSSGENVAKKVGESAKSRRHSIQASKRALSRGRGRLSTASHGLASASQGSRVLPDSFGSRAGDSLMLDDTKSDLTAMQPTSEAGITSSFASARSPSDSKPLLMSRSDSGLSSRSSGVPPSESDTTQASAGASGGGGDGSSSSSTTVSAVRGPGSAPERESGRTGSRGAGGRTANDLSEIASRRALEHYDESGVEVKSADSDGIDE